MPSAQLKHLLSMHWLLGGRGSHRMVWLSQNYGIVAGLTKQPMGRKTLLLR